MRIAYAGLFLNYRPRSPGFERASGIAASLTSGGASVVIGTADPKEGFSPPADYATLEIEPIRFQRRSGTVLTNFQSWWTFANDTVRWLEHLKRRPDVVVAYGGGQHFVRQVTRWARSRDVVSIADVPEWYHPEGKLGRLNPVSLDAEAAMWNGYAKSDGVLTVSTFLESHFAKLGANVLRVPSTLDVNAVTMRRGVRGESGALRLAYAGNPGKGKDSLNTILAGIKAADPSGQKITISIAGPSQEQVMRIGGFSELPPWITAHGRISHADVLSLVSSADFTVLLRPDRRSSHAGFSSKFVESMSCGTPVIANLTSDIGRYLLDGKSGLTVAHDDPIALAHTLRRAMQVPPEEKHSMRIEARQVAEKHFDYRAHTASLLEFFENTVASSARR